MGTEPSYPMRHDALASLRRFSQVSAPQDGLVSVHRLVQAVTIDQLPADQAETWRHAIRSVIEAALPDDRERPESWPGCCSAARRRQARARFPDHDHERGNGVSRVFHGKEPVTYQLEGPTRRALQQVEHPVFTT